MLPGVVLKHSIVSSLFVTSLSGHPEPFGLSTVVGISRSVVQETAEPLALLQRHYRLSALRVRSSRRRPAVTGVVADSRVGFVSAVFSGYIYSLGLPAGLQRRALCRPHRGNQLQRAADATGGEEKRATDAETGSTKKAECHLTSVLALC